MNASIRLVHEPLAEQRYFSPGHGATLDKFNILLKTVVAG